MDEKALRAKILTYMTDETEIGFHTGAAKNLRQSIDNYVDAGKFDARFARKLLTEVKTSLAAYATSELNAEGVWGKDAERQANNFADNHCKKFVLDALSQMFDKSLSAQAGLAVGGA